MANPSFPLLAEATAEALSGTTNVNAGLKHQALGAGPSSTPNAGSRLLNLEHGLMELLARCIAGLAIDLDDGLKVGVFAIKYSIGATAYTFNGSASTTLNANKTTVLYLDTDQTLKTSESGYPGGSHFKLATVITDATDVTSVADDRSLNYQAGAINNWWTYPPQAGVSFNSQILSAIGGLALSGPSTVTLNGSNVADIQAAATKWIKLDTNGGAGTQDLTSLGILTSGPGGYDALGSLFLLTAADTAHVVTVKSSALTTANGDYVLDHYAKFMIVAVTESGWTEVFRSTPALNAVDVTTIGRLNFKNDIAYTIASGVITLTGSQSNVAVRNESAASSDDLDTINGAASGDLLLLRNDQAGQTTVVKHNTGNIRLWNSQDFNLINTTQHILLKFDGSNWREVCRSWIQMKDLNGIGKGIAHPVRIDIPGALSVGVWKVRHYFPHATYIVNATGSVGTAPSGGACIVDVRDDGSSIFANQSEMINIADGTTSATSTTNNHLVAAGSFADIEVELANSAADLSVTLNCFVDPKTPPV